MDKLYKIINAVNLYFPWKFSQKLFFRNFSRNSLRIQLWQFSGICLAIPSQLLQGFRRKIYSGFNFMDSIQYTNRNSFEDSSSDFFWDFSPDFSKNSFRDCFMNWSIKSFGNTFENSSTNSFKNTSKMFLQELFLELLSKLLFVFIRDYIGIQSRIHPGIY